MNNIIFTALLSLSISLLLGMTIIPLLRALKLGHHIREEEPKNHQKKAGTLTFGGIIFILSTSITMLIMKNYINSETLIALYSFIAFGFIGFIDDSMKTLRKKNLGLKAYQKMLLILLVSYLVIYFNSIILSNDTSIVIPFLHKTVDLGIWFIPFTLFYFACTTNGANLSDGLDGLAATIALLIMTFFAVLSFGLKHYSLGIFCTAVTCSVFGFLKYNSFPAKIFMGDTGSLALGGVIATVAMILKLPIIILLAGIIYVLEILSVVLQIASLRLTGKRIFKMSPIHYHFELSGLHETKVVILFCIITVVFCIIAFFSLIF